MNQHFKQHSHSKDSQDAGIDKHGSPWENSFRPLWSTTKPPPQETHSRGRLSRYQSPNEVSSAKVSTAPWGGPLHGWSTMLITVSFTKSSRKIVFLSQVTDEETGLESCKVSKVTQVGFLLRDWTLYHIARILLPHFYLATLSLLRSPLSWRRVWWNHSRQLESEEHYNRRWLTGPCSKMAWQRDNNQKINCRWKMWQNILWILLSAQESTKRYEVSVYIS